MTAGNFDEAAEAVETLTDDQIRIMILNTYPVGKIRFVMESALAKLTREEAIAIFGTQCEIWGAGLAMGRSTPQASVPSPQSTN